MKPSRPLHHIHIHILALALSLALIASTTATPTVPPPILHTDILVIGAGTSGCVLAARLCTALPNRTVTLLERAAPRTRTAEFLVRSPRQMWAAWDSPRVVERFSPRRGRALRGRVPTAFTGATLGGSSAINGMQWMVPRNPSIPSWRIHGLTNVTALPFFRRAFSVIAFAAQKPPFRQRHVDLALRAARRAGYATISKPFDSRDAFDFFENRLAIDRAGRRRDACSAYLAPVRRSKCAHNLRLIQSATVSRIFLSSPPPPRRPRATGVEYTTITLRAVPSTTRVAVRPHGQILVAAGPFGSPKLLQLSGIGPRKLLRRVGVAPRVDLPVGERLISRPFAELTSRIQAPLEPSNNSTLLNDPAQRALWHAGRGGVHARASFFANGHDRADAYLTGTGSFFPSRVDVSAISTNCNANVARSRGYLRITANNASAPLDLHMALLESGADFRRLKRCLHRLRRLHEQLQEMVGATWINPADGRITDRWIRENAEWAGHTVGGCAVGSVLTGRLRVRGVRGLRVVDASAIPEMPESAGPMASTFMLAEYMAEMIAGEYGRGQRGGKKVETDNSSL